MRRIVGIAAVAVLVCAMYALGQGRPQAARIVVKLPAEATLTIDGDPTRSTGSQRIFNTPQLPAGQTFNYTLVATWTENGQPRSETKKISVTAGKETVVEFTAAKPATKPPGTTPDDPKKNDKPIPDEPKKTTTPPTATDLPITYRVDHNLLVKDVPAGTKELEIWFWIPHDGKYQRVLDLDVRIAPSGYKIIDQGLNRYLYVKVANPDPTQKLETFFRLQREPVLVKLDVAKPVSVETINKEVHGPDLARNVPNMEVDADVEKLANEICGDEKDVVKQARLIYDYVLDKTDYVGKVASVGASASVGKPNPNKPKNTWGSVHYCLDHKGGGCIDQHSLFIALARARGIPTRMQFGTMLDPAQEGKVHNPGHRCWVQYFVPTYGWVPLDVAAVEMTPEKKDFYFSNLDARRLLFLEGRHFRLARLDTDGPTINLLLIAHVLADGKEHENFERSVRFEVEK